MGRITAYLFRQFRLWDRPSRLSFALAILMIFPALIAVIIVPDDLRGYATGSVIGLIISAQLIFMWANRHMVTEYVQAQRHFIAEEFETARDLLETRYATGRADFQELTLLGNTYRQLGDLSKSAAVLSEALDIQPNHYFPLYGFGRTLLVQGRYAEAIKIITQALDAGAPPAVRFDLGEAQYHLNNDDAALRILQSAQDALQAEPHRHMMAVFLVHQLGGGAPPADVLIAEGLPYWRNQATLYADTPYGQAVQALMDQLQVFTREQ